MTDEDTLSPEYPREFIKSGIRGKYVSRYQKGTTIVLLEPELPKLFPNSEAVNRTLRKFAEEHHL